MATNHYPPPPPPLVVDPRRRRPPPPPASPVPVSAPATTTISNNHNNNNIIIDLSTSEEDEFELISEVEWSNTDNDDDDDVTTTGELAVRPRLDRRQDTCGCCVVGTTTTENNNNTKYCTDESCILYACQEECSASSCGPHCGNQRIAKKQWKRVAVFDAGSKGRGLKVLECVKKGEFIIEYVGRAIRKTYLDRLFQRYRNERMLYIMALDTDVYIDARKKGSLARYINHSCEPNAKVERWKVRGVLRAGVFALRDISAGEELSFDYKWDRKRGRAPTKCHCFTPSCRGTLEMPKSMEENELDRQLVGHWRRPPSFRAGREIVNRSIRILSEEHQEYFSADVCKYDETTGQHLVIYTHDLEEVWEDLSKEEWMILDEEAEQFVIAKKKLSSQGGRKSLLDTAGMTAANGEQPIVKKNYILVQTPVKDQFLSKHLIERCQRNCQVIIDVEPLKKPDGVPPPIPPNDEAALELQRAWEASKDGTAWKLIVTGHNVSRALTILGKNVEYLERMLHVADPSNGSSESNGEEVIIPRCIVDHVKRKLPVIRDICKSVNVSFAHSESKSKSFARLLLEGSLASDMENAKNHLWNQLVSICKHEKAPMSPSRIYKDLAFLAGELSSDQFNLLVGEAKDSKTVYGSEDLHHSTFVRSFESTQRCTIWIQSAEDKGRIDSKNVVVGEATPNAPRKIYLGCAPNIIEKLWNMIMVRTAELARGVKYLHLGKDRMYQQLMLQNGGQFFHYIRKVTGVSVAVDSMTGDHLRIDGRTSDQPSLNSSPWPESGRVAVAEELIRLQIELYRDHSIRQHNWIFGRDWSLPHTPNPSGSDAAPRSPSTYRSSALSVRNHFEPKAISAACFEAAEITTKLELSCAVAGHACIIMYRFASIISEQDQPTSQMKTRDLLLGSILIANKAQKARKWKRMDALLEIAYQVFYPGAVFDRENEEVLIMEKRVLDAEREILQTLDYDVFWRGVEWILPAAAHAISEPLAFNALDLALTGPVLAAGSCLWLTYGIEYVFAAVAGFVSVDLERLCLALSLIPPKVSQAAEIIANSITSSSSSSKKGASSSLFGGKDALLSQLPTIREICIKCMSSGMVPGAHTNPRNTSEFITRYELVGNSSRCQRTYQRVPSSLVKDRILPIIDGMCAESNCRIFVGASTASGSEDVILEGSWRALAIAEYLMEAACGTQDSESNLHPVLPRPTDKVIDEDRTVNLQTKLQPGLMSMSSVQTTEGWDGTIQSTVLDNTGSWGRRIGGKCCIAGKVSESSARHVGLRWWIPPRYGPSPTGSICDMFCIRSFSANSANVSMEHIQELTSLAKELVGESVASEVFPSLASLVEVRSGKSANRSVAVSLQRWPSEKVENRERQRKSSNKSSISQDVGFSPAALQEMQLLTQLHSLIPSPRGHPNMILPIAIATPSEKDDEADQESASFSPYASAPSSDKDIFSLFRTNEDNEKAAEKEKKRKCIETGPHLIFHPTPFILQRFTSRSKRRKSSDRSGNDDSMLSPPILQAWFHDLLSALVHCHTNHVVLRTLQPDQIVVDHSGVAKLGGFYRATMIPPEERRKPVDPLKSAKSRKSKHDDTNDEVASNSYIAPEILLGSTKHTKATDVWSMGCLLAHLLLSKPFFVGKDRDSLLESIFKIVGVPSKDNYKDAKQFPFYSSNQKKRYKRGVRRAFEFIMGETEARRHSRALDLLDQMLHLDPAKRISAVDALKHDYMANYVENCNTDSFRQQYVQDWLALKQKLMQSSRTADEEAHKRERDVKRKAMMLAASADDDGDDLYDMSDLLGESDSSKKQKLDY